MSKEVHDQNLEVYSKESDSIQDNPIDQEKILVSSMPYSPDKIEMDINPSFQVYYPAPPPPQVAMIELEPNSQHIPKETTNNNLYQSVFDANIQNHQANDRRAFIKKVYALLTIQLIWTVFFIGIVVGIPEMRDGIQMTVGLFFAALVITLILIIAIMCFKRIARRYPYNYIAMFTFTLFESYIVAFVCSYYDPYVVLCAVLLAFAVTVSLTVYAFKTKSDFTVCGGVLVSVTVSLIMFGFLMIFFHQRYVNIIFCEIAIILYSIFIVYDTQLIAGGRYQEISYDDYVIGAVMLYVDIIGLFMYILSLLGSKSG